MMANIDMRSAILQNILQYGNIGIHVIDNQRKTVMYNEVMAELEGLSVKQVMDKDILEIFPSLNDNTSTLVKVIDTEEAIINSTQTYFNYKGKSITTISTTIPIFSGDKIVGALEIANNLTNIRNLSEQLLDLQKELNSTKIKKNEFKNSIKKYSFSHIIGNNRGLNQSIEIAKKASISPSSVLIYGETGTGKEMFAQSIHNEGIRKDKAFIAQNCAAIPESLLEGILFGTEKGGFTGAIDREGIFEQAQGGTLLLDEINSMDLSLQTKLLRVLQEGYIRRIGGSKDIAVDVRIIATTNEDPLEAIEKGKLRKDLYYRLSVINILVPPLRDRLDDIELLCAHFIDKYNHMFNKNVRAISEEVMDSIRLYSWPGNIRELENFIEGGLNIVDDNVGMLTKKEFVSSNILFNGTMDNQKLSFDLVNKSLPEYIGDLEKNIILNKFQSMNYNLTKTANSLGIKRQTLQHKLKKYR